MSAPSVIDGETSEVFDEDAWGGLHRLSNDAPATLGWVRRVSTAITTFAPLTEDSIPSRQSMVGFTFDRARILEGHDFSVFAQLETSRTTPETWLLAMNVSSRSVGLPQRHNTALTLVVDDSASMNDEGRLHNLKRGLLRMLRELKRGDVVNVVFFADEVCTPMQNFVVGRDEPGALTRIIHSLKPHGKTDLYAGLMRGYQVATETRIASHHHRILLLTDMSADESTTPIDDIVSNGYRDQHIRLSVVGFGNHSDSRFLEASARAGHGSFASLTLEPQVETVFGQDFASLLETAADDVEITLHLPNSLRLRRTSPDPVPLPLAHSVGAGTATMFLVELDARAQALALDDGIMLELDYADTVNGEHLEEFFPFTLRDIVGRESNNLRKAELVAGFTRLLATLAQRKPPEGWSARPGGWPDETAFDLCRDEQEQLESLSTDLADLESDDLRVLTDNLCARFAGGGRPTPEPSTVNDPEEP